MSDVGWGEDDLVFRVLDDPPSDFDCGRAEQNEYLHERAVSDQEAGVSRTYIAYVKGMPAGYLTVLSDALLLYSHERGPGVMYSRVPALKIGQLAVDRRWQGHGLATRMVEAAIVLARDLSRQIGLRYVTVDAKQDLAGFYRNMGFKRNKLVAKDRKKRSEERGDDPASTPISMRFDIRDPEEQFTISMPQRLSPLELAVRSEHLGGVEAGGPKGHLARFRERLAKGWRLLRRTILRPRS